MKSGKTASYASDVQTYLEAIQDPRRRADCQTLIALMQDITGQAPYMSGTSIVGFGRHAYHYDSGRRGESCCLGFSSRKGDISIYLVEAPPQQAQWLAQLGKHRMGKACLYLPSLAQTDLKILRQLMGAAYEQVCRLHGGPVPAEAASALARKGAG